MISVASDFVKSESDSYFSVSMTSEGEGALNYCWSALYVSSLSVYIPGFSATDSRMPKRGGWDADLGGADVERGRNEKTGTM